MELGVHRDVLDAAIDFFGGDRDARFFRGALHEALVDHPREELFVDLGLGRGVKVRVALAGHEAEQVRLRAVAELGQQDRPIAHHGDHALDDDGAVGHLIDRRAQVDGKREREATFHA